jgi:exonuclease SbcC
MIPIKLSISGFLSYRDRVEIDFTAFDLACISGQNGAGKSSLLDAITWALFGQARRRDESLINSHPNVKAAEVIFQFEYEGSTYRIQRTLPRGKTTLLEFHILQQGDGSQRSAWKPLTERALRETQARIENILRMDYETFINASFFLQGKADQFTQQRPGDRKRILGSILGLDAWELYQKKAADLRKNLETQIQELDGRLQEINVELDEEAARKAHLGELLERLDSLEKTRLAQEAVVETVRNVTATLDKQRLLVEALRRQAEAATQRLSEHEERLAARREEKETFTQLIARQDEIRKAYATWKPGRRLRSDSANRKNVARHHWMRLTLPAPVCSKSKTAYRNGLLKLKSSAKHCPIYRINSQQPTRNFLGLSNAWKSVNCWRRSCANYSSGWQKHAPRTSG